MDFLKIQNLSSDFGLQRWQSSVPVLHLDTYLAMFCDSAFLSGRMAAPLRFGLS